MPMVAERSGHNIYIDKNAAQRTPYDRFRWRLADGVTKKIVAAGMATNDFDALGEALQAADAIAYAEHHNYPDTYPRMDKD